MIESDLPRPTRTRWQPIRLGLVDLFLYDHAEFRFRDGHLLLRGNNGTGKSKVLALTLPFLLDGELSAARVEPDGDPTKRMEWNLLMGGRHSERLGYTWLEFGRRDDAGADVFLTVGCGLKAVGGRGIVDHWFFVASGRIGVDFGLVGPTGVAHTRERLAETLGGLGHVYRRAEDYRRAIDERLFRLGPDRYESLVKLLIQLRQPQLTRRPDEERLSRALSEALRPVDQAILNVVADAFHDLEQQRLELDALKETHTAVDRFLSGYRRYAAVAARRLARDVRSSHSIFQASQRELAEVRQELERAEADDRAAADARDRLRGDLAGSRGRAAELRDSREVRELDAADRLVQMADRQAQQAAALQAEAVRELTRQREVLNGLRASAAEAERQLQSLVAEVDRAARVAGLPTAPAELVAALTPTADPPAEERAIDAAEQAAASSARTRAEATRYLRGLIEHADTAIARLEDARQRLHERIAERDSVRDLLVSALQELDAAAASFVDSWRVYLRSLLEIRHVPADDIVAQVGAWSDTLDGPDPGRTSILQAADTARNALSELRARALGALDETAHALSLLTDERERLLRGELLVPPQPYTRDEAARQTRDGAPLWQLVDFRPDLPDSQRAGLEAALESAAILDAWVTPDGHLLSPDTHDVILLAGSPIEPAASLTAALVPAIDHAQPRAAAVDETLVRRVLGGIGLGRDVADTWVDASGNWRVGVLEGSWSKPAPTFIGRGARDAARRQRLDALAVEIERFQLEVEARRQEVQQIEARQRALSDEISRMPTADALRENHRSASDARRQLARADARVAEHEAIVNDRGRQAQIAHAARDEAAVDLQLSADRAQLDAIAEAIAQYGGATAGLWPRARYQLQALGRVRTGQRQLEHVESALAERTDLAQSASRAASEERGRRDGLRASIGATVEHIRSELEAISGRILSLENEATRLDEVRRNCANRIGRGQDSQIRLERSLVEQDERRALAITVLQRFAANGLLIAAVPGLEIPTGWSPDPAARLARRVEQALETTDADDQTWERLKRDITTRFKDLQDGMSFHGHSAILDPVDGWHVVTIAFHGQPRSPDELVALLSDEIEHRERLLNARERELIEEHLVNEIASHLQELIHDAEVQVNDMNQELRQRPTSTGMRLRFRWTPRPDGPAGLPEARARLMRQVHDAWSADDRGAVSAFLKAQIDAVRAANVNRTWLEHLTEALDYRHWHRFTIERMQDGHWRSANGPASSGERVLTVTLPLFAAASAHYRSAHSAAPRLVLMDEVFAGVDDDSRSKSIGLLDTFDLDFVMTSEREWGCYPTLPGLAIYQLARREGIDAVHSTAWTWDGRTPVRMEPVQPSSMIPLVVSSNGVSTNGRAHGQNGA